MSDTPKMWHDMTDAEKGALLLAHHEGKVIECWLGGGAWEQSRYVPGWSGGNAYRVCSEPLRLTVGKRYRGKNDDEWECIFVRDDVAWLAEVFKNGEMDTAYRLNLDGTGTDLGDEYDIIEELP